MSGILKVFLLLAVMVCISKAQLFESGQNCLCRSVRKGIAPRSKVKDIQINPSTAFCDKVEIVVTLKSGLRYCLDPELDAVKRMLENIMKQRTSTTVRPTEVSSTPDSTNTAHI